MNAIAKSFHSFASYSMNYKTVVQFNVSSYGSMISKQGLEIVQT